jgi:hypothetical protein
MKKSLLTHCVPVSIFLLLIGVGPTNGMEVVFLHRLADFEGIVPSLFSRIAVDEAQTEVFTLNQRDNDIRIFNGRGMEIFSLGDDVSLSGASDLDIGKDGDIYIVYPRRGGVGEILRLDYKGESLAAISLKNLPPDFHPFSPSLVQYMDDMLYLVDTSSMDLVVSDSDGQFQKGYHLKAELLQLGETFENSPDEDRFADPESITIFGFCVDREGNIFFTVPVLFSAFKRQVDGTIKMFGVGGGATGKFGVIAGIDTDGQGNIYITDRLRSVVLIFDSSFEFLTEFGYRGGRDSSLVVPDDVAINDGKRLIYVAQGAKRGVSVFRIVGE